MCFPLGVTISATATAVAPTRSAPAPMGTDGATDAADSSGFAEQLQGFKAADPIAVALTPHAPVASIKVAAGSEQATDTAESTDNSTGAAMLAALLFGVTGAAPTALPLELHLTGDSLPSVEATGGTGTPSGQQRLLAGILDAQVMAAQLEAAATQVQQPAAALLELVQSKDASETSSPVPLPAVPAEGGSETTDMAFAARLRPDPATASDLASSHRSGEAVPRITAIAEFRRAEADGGRNQNTGLQPAQQMANPAAQTFITTDGSASPAATDKPPALADAETRTIAPEATPVKSTEPLKELSLQMGSPNQERVEVRMVERGGELHVAVRTGSADLAHGLREGIADLVSRLQETGFRTDTWRPVHGAAPGSAASGPQQSATEFRNHSDSQSNPGWSQQQTRDQREHQQSNRPSWVEELEGSLTPTAEPSPGEKHGLFR